MGQTLVFGHFKPLAIFIFPYILCSFLISTNSLTIQLIRRDHVDSNLFPKNLSAIEKHQIFAGLGLSRALYLSEQAMRLANPSLNRSTVNFATNTISPKLSQLQHSLFVVPITIGSQQYKTYLLLDTGCAFTWVKCRGCSHCFNLRALSFDPKHSRSYRSLFFNSPLCRQSFRIGGRTCGFNITYPLGDVTGIAALENMVFTAARGPPLTVHDLVLGCAKSAPKTIFDNNDRVSNPIAGVLGLALGRYQDSFMTRTRSITKMKFSYCLPPWDDKKVQTDMLFGDDVQPLPRSAQSTPLQTMHFYINFKDVSVAGKRLNLDPELFRIRRDGSGGFLIDTGVSYSYLVTPAYNKIKTAFVEALRSYVNPIPPVEPHDLCYSWPFPRIPHLPSLTYHLQSADLDVNFLNVFQIIKLSKKTKVACMMMYPREIGFANILGAAQQANYRFVHNLGTQTLSFYPEKCGGN